LNLSLWIDIALDDMGFNFIYLSESSGRLNCLLLSVLLILTTSVYAQGEDTPDESAFLGIGAQQCHVFISTYEHNPASLDDHTETGDEGPHHETEYTSLDYIHWVQGYLSGFNLHGNDSINVAQNASNGGMLNFLYRRCIETPDAPFYTVLPKLIERLESR